MRGPAGERALCRQCEQHGRCRAPYAPRAARGVSLVLGCLFNGEGGPWRGDHRRQPLWFLDLMQHARRVYSVALRELQQTMG